jgi:hypothetical protein
LKDKPMKLRQILPAFMAAAVVASTMGVAMAQQAAAPGVTAEYREVTDEQLVVQPFNLAVDRIDDMDVYGPGDEKIGEIDDVLMNAAGQPVAVSVEVGGFLGIGGREVIVMLDQLQLDGQRFVTSLTKAQIEALPRWDD